MAAEGWGVGRALPRDANADAMREAMREVLADPTYRENALAISHELANVDGASNAATEIEALLRHNIAG
jgi:UDP:flavonoid glycosyltransferase YjiC (YdhE family)